MDRARQRARAAKRLVLAGSLGVFGLAAGLAWGTTAGHASGDSSSLSSPQSRSAFRQSRVQPGLVAPAQSAPVVQTSQS